MANVDQPNTAAGSDVEEVTLDIDIRMVPCNLIEKNTWNPNELDAELFETLVANVKEDGGLSGTVLVRPHPTKEGFYECVDGEHRWKAVQAAGHTEVLCIVSDIDDEKAKLRTLSLNAIKGKNVPLKLAKIVADLQQSYSLAQIAAMTGVKKDEQETALKLLEVGKFRSDTGVHLTSQSTAKKPTEVRITMMPEEHGPYTAAIKKAMKLAGESAVTLIGNEVTDYNKAMSDAMGISGIKMRNLALAAICQAFLDMPEEQKKLAIAKIRKATIDKAASDAEQREQQAAKSDRIVKRRVRPITGVTKDPKAKDIAVKEEAATRN